MSKKEEEQNEAASGARPQVATAETDDKRTRRQVAPPPPPPLIRAKPQLVRPARPNLRRQVVVAAAGPHEVPMELAAGIGLPMGTASLPPKRPAHLPSRYDTFGRPASHLQPTGGAGDGKPNRYLILNTAAASGQDPGGGTHQQKERQAHHFASPFLVINNPMQMVNLSEHTKSRLIKIIEALKRFSEQWFSHVLLLMFLAVYACFGAYVFISFEAPTEQWEKQLIIETRQRMVNESWQEASSGKLNQREFTESFRSKLEDYERLLNRACASGMSSSSLENQWTFWGALFYSMTVFTTIGYGHLTPITFAGRVATMVYAIFGIPILLMVLADLGKLLTRIIKFAFKQFRSLYNKLLHRKSSIRTRKMISDHSSQYLVAARGAFERGFAHIQPQAGYASLPYALTSRVGGTFKRRFRRNGPEPALIVVADEATGAVSSADQGAATSLTDVIVTPASQTEPVSPNSPQPPTSGREKKSPLAAASAEHQQQTGNGHANQGHNHNHGSNSNNQHHNNNHHHHSGHSSHGHRSQSPPAAHGTQHKRKTSVTGSRSSKQQPKGSVSRSSSSLSSSANQHPAAAGNEKSALAADSKQPEAEVNSDHSLLSPEGAATSAAGSEMGAEQELEDLGDEDDILDEFDIPVSFALFLLVTYMMFGAVVFSIWEGWNFFDSLYFVFISMSTIGFGDLVPQHPKRMIGTFIYLLFGLALTSMCINVVQEKIHATFLRAKLQIGEKMGLDLEQIMADDYYGAGSMDGCDEGDDSQSVAVSQTNSSVHYGHGNHDDHEPSVGPVEHGTNEPTSALRPSSWGKDSLRGSSRRRPTTGLPGHSGSGGGSGSFLRRSQSRKLQRQTTPTSASLQATPSCDLANQSPAPEPNKEKSPPAEEPATPQVEPPTPKAQRPENHYEDLDGPKGARGSRLPLGPSRSQPMGVPKSLSSDAGFEAQLKRRPSGGQRQQPLSGRLSAGAGSTSGRRSADSSRRSSVSQELNQLDDLILKLSSCQLAQEKFGPLLGIPASGRSSRPNSPLSTSIGADRRRGTSMTSRSLARGASGAATAAAGSSLNQASAAAFLANHRLKRSSLQSDNRQPETGNSGANQINTHTSKPATGSHEAQKEQQVAALNELKSIKFSAV